MPGGRPKKPDQTFRVHGKPRRRTRKSSAAKPGIPSPPVYLDKMAKTEWRRAIKEMKQRNTITLLDRGVLAVYCQAYSDIHRLTIDIRDNGDTYLNHLGNPVRRPETVLLSEAKKTFHQHAASLGFTPVDRSRVIAKSEKNAPKAAKFGIAG